MHTQTFTHSLTAAGAGVQKRFVTFDGRQAVVGDKVLGVAMTDFVVGQAFTAHILGVAAVEAGGVLAAGDGVLSDALGRAVKSDANIAAYALSAAAAAGQIVFILLK